MEPLLDSRALESEYKHFETEFAVKKQERKVVKVLARPSF